MKLKLKLALKILAGIVAAVLLVCAAYLIYVFTTYYRIEDNLSLEIDNQSADTVPAGQSLSIMTWNAGFGAYSADYTFFMDGGKYSRAYSEEAVYDNIGGVADVLAERSPDFMFVQEVDTDSTRSHHVNEKELITARFSEWSNVFAMNYDSPYLFYPLTSPHGKSVSGILTMSRFQMDSSIRRSLPIETGFMKFVDLDRCYSVTKLPVSNGKTLCLFNIHLSAYTSDGTIATEQLKMLLGQMQEEYSAGNYVICGGDFNKDLLGDSSAIFGVSGEEYTWAQAFPEELIPAGFALFAGLDENDPVPSCRNTDVPYEKGKCFVVTVDGFIVSDNVELTSIETLDEGFAHTDHNPVYMTFTLAE